MSINAGQIKGKQRKLDLIVITSLLNCIFFFFFFFTIKGSLYIPLT